MSIYVIEQDKNGTERSHDLQARLLKDRIVYITGEFDSALADAVVAQLLYLESVDNTKDINFYINSPGGDLDAAYSIFDCMNYVKPDICTIAYGRAMSAGSFILAAGTKGKRFALPNANIMIHEFSSGSRGKFNDLELQHKQHVITYNKLIKYYAEFTGKDEEILREDMKKDFFMSSEEALTYGLIDKIQYKR